MNSNPSHEEYEKARKRSKQKKRLYFHFVLFLFGSIFFVILNKVIFSILEKEILILSKLGLK
jgi:ABC-type phosphate transport system permease subunit